MIHIPKSNDASIKISNKRDIVGIKECFVIMPITDKPPYEEGHFKIVYEHLIKPACSLAGFVPIRSDDIKNTNFIVKDILKRLLVSPMAICDLSGQNPNVLFELGIRQSFNKPVTLIKDLITPRIFDIDGLRCLDYNENLRVDQINISVNLIAETLKNTYESQDNKENSLIHSLSIEPAKLLNDQVLSNDTTVLLQSINNLKDQFDSFKYGLLQNSLVGIGLAGIPMRELTTEEMKLLSLPVQYTLDGGHVSWILAQDGRIQRKIDYPENKKSEIMKITDCNDQE